MLEVKSTLEQRIKQLMQQTEPGFNALTLDATKQIANVSAVIKRDYDPNIIPEDIGWTWINTFTGARRVSNGKSAISDWISTTSVAPTADIVGWSTDIVFSATDSDTVARTAGYIKLASGTSYSVNAGNTGNITAINYIYYDGTTTLKKTTVPQDAVGAGKLLICVAKNSTSPTLAQFQAFGTIGLGVLITADNIAANTITANQIAANTITANQISSSYVYAGEINADNITSGTITGRTLQTAIDGQRVIINSNGVIYFRDSDGDDAGYIFGSKYLGASFIFMSNGFVAGGNSYVLGNLVLGGNMLPDEDSSYNLGASALQWNNIYINNSVYIDGYRLYETSGNPRRNNGVSNYYIPYLTGSSTNKTTNASVKMNFGGTEYYVNVLAV